MTNFSFGALPPLGAEWQMGATVGSIDFVRDCEYFIEQNKATLTESQLLYLNTTIKLVKEHKKVITEEVNFSDIDTLINHLIKMEI
jgi:hypothetical protein